jgi:DNA-binding PadR family transcriptional regulator
MAGFATETTSPKSTFDESSVPCNCKSGSAYNTSCSPLNPYSASKKKSRKNSVQTKIEVFKGREQRVNCAIFCVLSKNFPLAIWDILQDIRHDLIGFKRIKYAIINVRVRALEKQRYLRVFGYRTIRNGGKTKLYKLTTKARLAIVLSTISIDDFINVLEETSALKLLKEISK